MEVSGVEVVAVLLLSLLSEEVRRRRSTSWRRRPSGRSLMILRLASRPRPSLSRLWSIVRGLCDRAVSSVAKLAATAAVRFRSHRRTEDPGSPPPAPLWRRSARPGLHVRVRRLSDDEDDAGVVVELVRLQRRRRMGRAG